MPSSSLHPERSDDWWLLDMLVESGLASGAGMNWDETEVLMNGRGGILWFIFWEGEALEEVSRGLGRRKEGD